VVSRGPVLRVQIDGIKSGVVAHDLGEGLDAAVATIGAVSIRLRRDGTLNSPKCPCFFQGCLARGRALAPVLSSFRVSRLNRPSISFGFRPGVRDRFSARSKPRQTGVVELAVGEIGSGMAGGAPAFPMKILSPRCAGSE